MDTPDVCHVCGTSDLRRIPAIEGFLPVSSDIRVVPGRLSLALCRQCGVLQKIATREWRSAVQEVYAAYAINHQGNGADPYIFKSLYGPGPRAAILAAYLSRALACPPEGELLDIGCANGNFLARFGEACPRWSLFGLEHSRHWRPTVLSLPGVRGFFSDLAELEGQRFDVIVMSHVLEHIPDPVAYLGQLRGHLKDGGMLFIAVPDIRQNPVDLLVIDHCSHFDPSTLGRVLRRGGFLPEILRTDILGKEILAISRPAAAPRGDGATCKDPFSMPLDTVAEKYLSLCSDLVEQARTLRQQHDSFGIMGTSTAAAWITGELAMGSDFYVEEDPQRIGRTAFGKPILSLDQVPPGACVFIPMSSLTAQGIIARAHRDDLTLAYLPWNDIADVQAKY
jgi:SAM-dependent methyltransferase